MFTLVVRFMNVVLCLDFMRVRIHDYCFVCVMRYINVVTSVVVFDLSVLVVLRLRLFC